MDALLIVIPLAVAAATAALATPVVARLATALGVVDVPDPRKVNTRPNIPLLGGVAIAVGAALGLAAAVAAGAANGDDARRLGGFFLGGILLLGLGAYDDRFGLGARVKLTFQIVAASIAFAFGFSLDYLTGPFSNYTYTLPVWLAFGLTVFWIVSVTNAMNLMDGLDGLATGIGTIIATTLTIICYQAEQPIGVLLGMALVGAQLGFLPFNFPPGRIFLGDTGAYFIGYAIAAIGLEGYRKTALWAFVPLLMALAVPLLDTGLSVIRRLRDRQRVMGADRLHMHHRLLKMAGGSQRDAVLSLYFLTACFCIIAVAIRSFQGDELPSAVALLVAVALLTVRLLRNLGLLAREEPSEAEAEGETVKGEGETAKGEGG